MEVEARKKMESRMTSRNHTGGEKIGRAAWVRKDEVSASCGRGAINQWGL